MTVGLNSSGVKGLVEMSADAPIIEQSLPSAQLAAVLSAIMNENIGSVRAARLVKNDHIPLSEQGSRLNNAFFKIQCPIVREAVIVLVEGLSAGPWWKHLPGKAV